MYLKENVGRRVFSSCATTTTKETLNETWRLAKSMQMRKFTTRVGAAGVCIKVVGANFTSTDKATFSLN